MLTFSFPPLAGPGGSLPDAGGCAAAEFPHLDCIDDPGARLLEPDRTHRAQNSLALLSLSIALHWLLPVGVHHLPLQRHP
jgi:hypothetical protein